MTDALALRLCEENLPSHQFSLSLSDSALRQMASSSETSALIASSSLTLIVVISTDPTQNRKRVLLFSNFLHCTRIRRIEADYDSRR